MSIKNGQLTYSKTKFAEKKHKRGADGTFDKKAETERDKVSYHHKFTKAEHPRKSDGSFNSYSSDAKHEEDSEGLKNGKGRYGS